jgi:hypothetical protein
VGGGGEVRRSLEGLDQEYSKRTQPAAQKEERLGGREGRSGGKIDVPPIQLGVGWDQVNGMMVFSAQISFG